jgi:SAM-dependent methyltransferase
MSPGAADRTADAEVARIREAYARRRPDSAGAEAGNRFMLDDAAERMHAALARHGCLPLAGKRILEIGCGSGAVLERFVRWGADPRCLTGIDVIEPRLASARQRLPEGVRLELADAAASGLAAASFDLVVQSTVFTSILSREIRERVAREMVRVLAPGGRILWYDFRIDNPRNRDVRAVGRAEIHRLFPGCEVAIESLTLAPPLARALAGVSRGVCELLARVPLLRTHYLAVIVPR